MVLLGCSAITTERDDKSNNERHLYRAYIQNCYLERQLRQESYHKYLLSSDSVLTLSDENLIPQIHSVLLNLVDEFSNLDQWLKRGHNLSSWHINSF